MLMNKTQLLLAAVIVIILSFVLGFVMGRYTDADLYYFDSFTTSGSLVAQYLLAKKYLQNWLLWIIVDMVAIPVYLYKGLYYFSLLFLVYLIICIYGYVSWKKNLSVQSSETRKGVWNKIHTPFIYFLVHLFYPKPFTCLVRLLLRLDALFLCQVFLLESLSIIEMTFGRNWEASVWSVISLSLAIAVLVDFL